MGCKYISYYDDGSGYHFYNSEKGLIESRDQLFFETTNVVIPSKQMKLLEDSSVYPLYKSKSMIWILTWKMQLVPSVLHNYMTIMSLVGAKEKEKHNNVKGSLYFLI